MTDTREPSNTDTSNDDTNTQGSDTVANPTESDRDTSSGGSHQGRHDIGGYVPTT